MLHTSWKKFIKDGVLDPARLSKRIMESWYRSKHNDVNPYLEKATDILSPAQLSKKKEQYKLFLELSKPHFDSLENWFKDLGVILLFTDHEGHVLHIQGEHELLNSSKRINLVEGVEWTEGKVGTSGVGTTLITKEPMKIIGYEHYSVVTHRWSCFSVPILNERNEILGIVDVSTIKTYDDLDMLSVVYSMARSIEHKWKQQLQENRLQLIQTYQNKKTHDSKDFLIFDNDGYFVTASKSIMPIMKDSIDFHMHMMSIENLPIAETKRHPIIENDRNVGYKIDVIPKTKNLSIPVHFPKQETFQFLGVKGISQPFQDLLKQMEKVTKSDITVYIHGESGTGKELIAKSIHLNCPRKNKPFVAINCGAVPKELLESELFGYEAGAFTGARKGGYKGKFSQADGGTVFLDEIGDMPLAMQVALLRVIQEREIIPIGAYSPQPVNVRIIAATHKNLRELVSQGKFREDLFYRLNVLTLQVPSLRERKEDIRYLIQHFCEKQDWQVKIPDSTMSYFLKYTWPGNIRELYNVLERIQVLTDDAILGVEHLPSNMADDSRKSEPKTEQKPFGEAIADQEGQLSYKDLIQRKLLIEALDKTKGDMRKTAELLGISLSTLYRKIKKYNL
jgi:transcriptional regulator of acetoin/glycerol metabolism